MGEIAHKILWFDRFSLDMARGALRAGGHEIGLRPKVYEVLRHLVENAGRLVPKQELHAAVWQNVFVGDDSLAHCIRELREKLGDVDHRLIKTVSRRGYILDTPILTVEPMAERQAQRSSASVPKRRLSAQLPLPGRPSIAVLPFVNLTHEPQEEYFSDGITDDIITELSRISELFVVARNSTFQYKGRPSDVRNIGRELGVRNILDGSVRRVGNRVRISVQLVDCSTGSHLWAERFDRNLSDIFRVQDEVAKNVVAALSVKLTGKSQWGNLHESTANLEAYDYFLRGREQRMQFSVQSITNAESALHRAIALDPNFSPPYAFLADCYIVRFVNGWCENASRLLDDAYNLAQKAVEIDSTYARAQIFLGHAYLLKRRHSEALSAIRRSIVLEPNSSRGHVWLGRVLHYVGRSKDAVAPINRGMRLDPYYHPNYLYWLGQVYFQLCRYSEAVEVLGRRLIRSPESDDSHVLLASAYGHLGRMSDASNHWGEALRINPNYSIEYQRRVTPYKNPSNFEHIVGGLRKAGIS